MAWRFDGEALMKYHLGLIQGLPQGHILPSAGLLGQPAPGSTCPTAPSVLHPKVGLLASTLFHMVMVVLRLITSALAVLQGQALQYAKQ